MGVLRSAGNAQEEVLGRDVLVLQLAGLFVGHVDHPLEPRGDEDLRHLAAVAGAHARLGAVLQVFLQLGCGSPATVR